MRSLDQLMRQAAAIPGWFEPTDIAMFAAIGALQVEDGVRGDILEIGVYQGKSAVVLGSLLRTEEKLIVCDIFDDPAPSASVGREWAAQYSGLTLRTFEANYRRAHGGLPVIHKAPSRELPTLGLPPTFRLMHIDGSHLYDEVQHDLGMSRGLAGPETVVIFDDVVRESAPGVAAAVWAAVVHDGLQPLALSKNKLYASWGARPTFGQRLDSTLQRFGLRTEPQEVAGSPLLIVTAPPERGARKLARQALPPAVAAYGRAARDRWRQANAPPRR